MATEAQKRATKKYDSANVTNLYIKLNINTELDIIERLEQVGNKSGYIKKLIRDDIAKKS